MASMDLQRFAVDGISLNGMPILNFAVNWGINVPVSCSVSLPLGKKILPSSGGTSKDITMASKMTLKFKDKTLFTGIIDSKSIAVAPYMGGTLSGSYGITMASPIVQVDAVAGGKVYFGTDGNIGGIDSNATSAGTTSLQDVVSWEEFEGGSNALHPSGYILYVKNLIEEYVQKLAPEHTAKMSNYMTAAPLALSNDLIDLGRMMPATSTSVMSMLPTLVSMPGLQCLDLLQSWFFLIRVPSVIDGSKYTHKPDFPMLKKAAYEFSPGELFGVGFNRGSMFAAPKWVIVNVQGLTLPAEARNDTGESVPAGISASDYAFWPKRAGNDSGAGTSEAGSAEIYELPGPFRLGSFKDNKNDPSTGTNYSGAGPYKQCWLPTPKQAAAAETDPYDFNAQSVAELVAKMEYGRRAFNYMGAQLTVSPKNIEKYIPLIGSVVKFPTPNVDSKAASLGPVCYGCLAGVNLNASVEGASIGCSLQITSVRTEEDNEKWGMDTNPLYSNA